MRRAVCVLIPATGPCGMLKWPHMTPSLVIVLDAAFKSRQAAFVNPQCGAPGAILSDLVTRPVDRRRC